MEDLKLTVNQDFAKKLNKQKEKAELDQCKYFSVFYERYESSIRVASELFSRKIIKDISLAKQSSSRGFVHASLLLLFVVKQKFGDKDLGDESESSSSESEDEDARVSKFVSCSFLYQ